jgi:amino acid adenylation domain-containing protein
MPKPTNIDTIYPLSPMQQGMLFHSLLTPAAAAYTPQLCLTLGGNLDIPAFQQAWQTVIQRHAVLRTAFRWEKRDTFFQAVYHQVPLPWTYHDWRNHPDPDRQLADWLERDRKTPIDLKTAPLFRLTLIHLSDQRHCLVWTQHHGILDGWSVGLVLKDLWTVYHGQPLGQSPRPYADYIAWLGQQDQAAAQQFWQHYLKEFTDPTLLASILSCRPPSPAPTPAWHSQQITLPASTTQALRAIAQQSQITLNTVLQGAWAILMARYCDTPDIVFGATTAGRPTHLPGADQMVGLFINTLPVRVRVPAAIPVSQWLQQFQAQQAETLAYEFSSLLEIQSQSDLPPNVPLFDTILVFENYPIDATALRSPQSLQLQDIRSTEWTSFPITVLIAAADTLKLELKFDRHQFSEATIQTLLQHYRQLLEGIIAQPHFPVGNLSLLTPTELAHLPSPPAPPPTSPTPLPPRLTAQADRTPNAIAASFHDQHLTYRDLNARANQLAHFLQAQGVGLESVVGVYADRSLELVICLWAVVKAGAAYLPLEPSYPLERLEFMVTDAQATCIIGIWDDTVSWQRLHTHGIHLATPAIAACPTTNPPDQTTLDSSVYVIYTSGSTGKPKGVINTQRGLLNRLEWMQAAYGLTPADRVLQKTPFSFDVSVWEFFWPALQGARLILAAPDGHRNSAYLTQLIATQQITIVHFVPSMLRVFLSEPDLETTCTSLRHVFCSGEALSPDLVQHYFSRLSARLHNLYGPTEAAIDVTAYECLPNQTLDTIPIGTPIHNTQIYLLDCHLRPVPIGVPGELYIAGPNLARGYLNRPSLTAEKFLPNPFAPDAPTLYKTGDRARYLPDGTIEYLGRLDDQIKLRGVRIELGEIEAVLRQHPDVSDAVVTLHHDRLNEQHLIAYVVLRAAASSAPLLDWLRDRLPASLIPSQVIELASLPLSANGKRDRRALPQPATFVSAAPPVQPRTPIEVTLAAIWREVLQLSDLSIHDNLFELGGNSLIAIRIHSRLCQAIELDLPLRSLFERPTIAQLADYIQTLQQTLTQMQPPLATAGRKEIEL